MRGPVKQPRNGRELDVNSRTYNALLRCLGERGFASSSAEALHDSPHVNRDWLDWMRSGAAPPESGVSQVAAGVGWR
jgi:hypothetical protein